MTARPLLAERRWAVIFTRPSLGPLTIVEDARDAVCGRSAFRTRRLARTFVKAMRAHRMPCRVVRIRVVVTRED